MPSVRCKGISARAGALGDPEVNLFLGLKPTEQSKRDGHTDRDNQQSGSPVARGGTLLDNLPSWIWLSHTGALAELASVH